MAMQCGSGRGNDWTVGMDRTEPLRSPIIMPVARSRATLPVDGLISYQCPQKNALSGRNDVDRVVSASILAAYRQLASAGPFCATILASHDLVDTRILSR